MTVAAVPMPGRSTTAKSPPGSGPAVIGTAACTVIASLGSGGSS
jgi:hypothetical protein